MQTLFDFSALYQTNALFSTSCYTKHVDLQRLKGWWRDLTTQEQAQICRIDTDEILSDLADASNDAFLVTKLSSEYRDKALVACSRNIDKKSGKQAQEYRFNFVEKDIIPSNLAELFSSYYLNIYKINKKHDKPNVKSDKDTTTQDQYSILTVKEESLCSLIEILESANNTFMKVTRPSFDGIMYSKLFSTLGDYSFQKFSAFRHIESSAIQKLLHKFVAITVLIENNIYQFNQQKVEKMPAKTILMITPETAESDISSQDTKAISPLLIHSGSKSLPLTPSQKIQDQKNNTFINSRNDPLISNIDQQSNNSFNNIFNSLNKIPNAESSNSDETTTTERGIFPQNRTENLIFSPFDFSLNPVQFFFGNHQNNWEEPPTKVKLLQNSTDVKDQSDETLVDQFANYDGFEIGNLKVDFDPMDEFLVRLGDRNYSIEELKQEIMYEKMEQEELSYRKYNYIPQFHRRFVQNGSTGSNLNLQRNFTDPVNSQSENHYDKIDNYGYYSGGNSNGLYSPRKGKRFEENFSRRSDEIGSAPVEWRDSSRDSWPNYDNARDNYAADSFGGEYRYRPNYKKNYQKNDMKVYYYPKEKLSADSYIKTPRQSQQQQISHGETAVES